MCGGVEGWVMTWRGGWWRGGVGDGVEGWVMAWKGIW